MFTLAHLSDLHMAIEPRGSQLLSKRGLGLINWRRKRNSIHRRNVLDALTRDLKAQRAGHIAVTGDLVNFSLPAEYALARDWLKSLGAPRDVTVLPGNHDVYVRGVESLPAQYWGDYMRGDDGLERFPFVRRRDNVALIALSSGVATGPFMATGKLGTRQLARFAEALDQTRDAFRVVLIHHPPRSPVQRYLRRLTDAAAFRRVLAEKGAELLLHGHDHRSALIWLDGPGGRKIPAAGVPSASAQSAHGEEGAAAYHLFTIDGTASANSRCEMITRQRGADGTIREAGRKNLL
ncbi:MAG TPA: metallophosphoesterase [Xanthobacteraceae bacterium]|jgi:3',5'-cyclic AMP phosphodiesterase CpdA|nr:metallophosphoesterase [Xanthobacteraceae bacterium]